MRKSHWSLFLLLTLAIAFWWFGRPESAPQENLASPVPAPLVQDPPRAVSTSSSPVTITSPTQLQAAASSAEQSSKVGTFTRIEAPPPPPIKIPGGYQELLQTDPAHQETEEVALNIRNYGQRFGGNPVGTNAEIVKALNGGNQAGSKYLPSNHRMNGSGELIDRWGTPLFFHANSATEMEVRSAGPDRKLFTTDDLTAR